MRFNPGDKFINKNSGYGGVVKGVVYGPFGNDELEIEWDHIKGKNYKYNLFDIKDEWSHPSTAPATFAGTIVGFEDFKGMANFAGSCQHDFKEYFGLSEAYRYCTKCDKKESI